MKLPLPEVRWRKVRGGSRGYHSDAVGKPPGKRPGVVTIDPRIVSHRITMDTLIHEGLHEFCPYLDEYAVEQTADALARLLWREGYRKVNL